MSTNFFLWWNFLIWIYAFRKGPVIPFYSWLPRLCIGRVHHMLHGLVYFLSPKFDSYACWLLHLHVIWHHHWPKIIICLLLTTSCMSCSAAVQGPKITSMWHVIDCVRAMVLQESERESDYEGQAASRDNNGSKTTTAGSCPWGQANQLHNLGDVGVIWHRFISLARSIAHILTSKSIKGLHGHPV